MNKEVEEAKMIFNKLKEVNEELQKDEEEGHGSAYEMQAEDFNAIETILNYIKELEQENKHLRDYIVVAPNLDEMTETRYQLIQREGYINGLADAHQRYEEIIKDNYIPKSKIQDKIEEQYTLWNTPNKQKEYSQEIVNVLEQLLEEGE